MNLEEGKRSIHLECGEELGYRQQSCLWRQSIRNQLHSIVVSKEADTIQTIDANRLFENPLEQAHRTGSSGIFPNEGAASGRDLHSKEVQGIDMEVKCVAVEYLNAQGQVWL